MSDEKPNVTYDIRNVGLGGIVAHTIDTLIIKTAGIDDPLKDYYRRLARECQLTTLTVIESDALATDEVCAVDIYVQPEVRIIDDGKARKAGEAIERDSEPRRVPLLACLTSTDPTMQRLVLTAPSGFGKSTAVNVYLQKLVMQQVPLLMLRLPALRKSASSHPDEPAIRRVELALAKDIAAKTDPTTNATTLATRLIDQLDATPGVILFDALDEVPQGEREDVIACVRTFLKEREKEQPTHRVLITSRPYAFAEHSQRFAKDNFRHIELAEFTPVQQDELIGKWFAQRDKLPATGSALVAQISAARSGASVDQTALARLMTEPMLLTYACMLAHARAPAEGATDAAPLPPSRHDLFEGVVSLMLEKWDPKRNNSDVAEFQRLFQADGNRRSILRQCLEHSALQELQGLDRLLVRYQSETFVAPKGFTGSLTQEKLVHWLDDAMPDGLPVRARTIVKWLAQRSGLLHAATGADGPRYVLQAQLRDFLAAGGMQSMVQSENEYVRAALALLGRQPQWYRPMMSTVLARLRDAPLALASAVEEVLAPPVRKPEADDRIVISAHNQNTPDFVMLHFVIAWANAFGEAGANSQKNTVLEQALTTLRHRCLELVTAPAEGKPPIELRAEAADALGLIGDPRFDPSRWHLPAKRVLSEADEPIPGFVRIAAGEFMMGDKRETNNPPRKVRIENPFYIARYATTVAQFRHFVDEGGYEEQQWWDDDGLLWLSGEYDKRVRDNEHLRWLRGRPPQERRAPDSWTHQLQSPSRPVVGVSWFEARAYARWLDSSLRPALKHALVSEHAVQLPTEPQWERAARWAAGVEGYDDRRWPWGNDEAGAVLYAKLGGILGRAASVGLYEPTGPKLFDMAGNAWGWMDNAYSAATDARFDRASRNHVWQYAEKREDSERLSLRGGSWIDRPKRASCSCRIRSHPARWIDDVGFRVVLSLAKNEN